MSGTIKLAVVLWLGVAALAPAASAQQRLVESAGMGWGAAGENEGSRVGRGVHPVVRSTATVLASAGGFALAQASLEGGPDDLRRPIAAGAAMSMVAGWLFSDAPRLRVAAGSVLGTIPASALATYVAAVMADETQGGIPMIVFSVPQGLLTSAVAQRRR